VTFISPKRIGAVRIIFIFLLFHHAFSHSLTNVDDDYNVDDDEEEVGMKMLFNFPSSYETILLPSENEKKNTKQFSRHFPFLSKSNYYNFKFYFSFSHSIALKIVWYLFMERCDMVWCGFNAEFNKM
jgi:hypothetical protein